METQRQRQTRRQGGEGRQPALVSLRLQSNFSTDGISRRAKKLENHESRVREGGWVCAQYVEGDHGVAMVGYRITLRQLGEI